MAWLQKFLLRMMPAKLRAAAIADTKQWRVRCLTCGFWRDLYSLGGIRYKAASKGKRTLCRCPVCRKLRASAVERIPPGEEPPPLP
jgi:hypothetical protein